VTRKKTRRKACVFDIETIADPEMAKLLPAVKAAGNLKDPEKIKIDIKEKEKKRRNEMGLHPLQNMVCCMAIHDLERGKSQAITMVGDTGRAEKLVLEKAWEALSNYDFFVSFNGIEFDVRVLNLNSLKRRVRPGVIIDTRKYQVVNHMDLRAYLGNWEKFAHGTLDYYMKIFFGDGEGKPDDIDGSLVQHYWDMELHDEISAYAITDVENTARLWNLVCGHLFPFES
jgi:predicted PolB exonuclease-like 3'-5' exonuclease